MCSQHLQLKRVDLDRSLAKKKKKKKYLPPSSNFEKPPDEKQLCFFFMRPNDYDFDRHLIVAYILPLLFQPRLCRRIGINNGKVRPELIQTYTVRPLFKKFTQPCETYEPTNCCVRKLTQVVQNVGPAQVVIFYTSVGRFICFTVLCNILNSGLTV